jgi:RimJ/RimL family protein N-acetyltransferase
MKPGTIVYKGKTKIGTDILIRYPAKTDVMEMTRYINTLSKERTFVRFQGEQQSIQEERKYLRSLLKKIKERKAITLLIFHDGLLIGSSGIEMRDKAEYHVGNFGISIAKDYRGEGMGTLLMRLVLEEAKKHLPNLKLCVLGVCEGNDIAHAMYKQFGFIEYGKLPKGVKHKEEYVDHIYMYKTMNSFYEKETASH